ncbi:hypothetical protein Btru_074318 [Bulinus truncatus]|nr:hypothetical protein Btru_074318 [Bulinus truncatus]
MCEREDTLRTLLFDDPDSFGTACLNAKISFTSELPVHHVPENGGKFAGSMMATGLQDVNMLNVVSSSPSNSSPRTTIKSQQMNTLQTNPLGENLIHGFNICGQVAPSYYGTGTFHSPQKPGATIPTTVIDSNNYRPLRAVSTPSNNLQFQNSSLAGMKTISLPSHSATVQTNVKPTFLKHFSSSLPKNLSHEIQISSVSNDKDLIHKMSLSSDHHMPCYTPLVMTSDGQNLTPKIDSKIFCHSSEISSLNGSTVNRVPLCDDFLKNSECVQKSSQFDSERKRLCSPKSPSTLTAVTFSSHNSKGNNPLIPENFSQNYASLVPWTSKLTAPGYEPLPAPAVDAMPIPLENTEKGSMLSLSPTALTVTPRSSHPRNFPMYSRLRPGMVNGDTNMMTKLKNGAVRNTSHIQRIHCKALLNKEHRFKKTADALQKSGLWDVAMKTGNLIKRNQELQRELEEFRADALTFLKSVIKNPQNRDFIKNVLNNALSTNTSPCDGSSVMSVVVSAAAAAAASVQFNPHSSDSSSDSGSMSNLDHHHPVNKNFSKGSAAITTGNMDLK